MNRKFRLSTALDIDDLLMECVPYAIRLANEKYQFDPPLTIYELNRWGKLGTRPEAVHYDGGVCFHFRVSRIHEPSGQADH